MQARPARDPETAARQKPVRSSALSLRTKLRAAIVGLPVFVVLAVGLFYTLTMQQHQLEEAQHYLAAVNDSRAAAVSRLVQQFRQRTKSLAASYPARQLSADGRNDSATVARIQQHIESVFSELDRDENNEIDIVGVWDVSGAIIANTSPELIGKAMPGRYMQAVHDHGSHFAGLQLDPLTGRSYLVFLEPIRSWRTDELAGAVVLKVKVDLLNALTTDRTRLGRTGETYIVDERSKRMVTESRFMQGASLRQVVSTLGVDAAVAGRSTRDAYPDYRGVPVLGAGRRVSDVGWVILTEIDEAEVYDDLWATARTSLLLTLALGLAFAAFAWRFGDRLVGPIERLATASARLADGDLDARVEVERKDEIGQLSRSFNEMAENIQRSEAALREEETKFRTLFEESRDAIVVFDGERMIDCNSAAIDLFGFETKSQLLEQNPLELSPAEQPGGDASAARAETHTARAVEHGSTSFEWLYTRRDGRDGGSFHADVTLTSLVLHGRPVTQHVIRDTTDRKRAEAQLQEASALRATILDTVIDGIMTIDESGEIQSFNRAACEMFGYTSDELIGRNVSMLMPAPHASRHQGYIERYLRTGEAGIIGKRREGLCGLRKDGTTFPLELAVNEAALENRHLFIGSVRDITERERAARELEEARQLLQSALECSPAGVVVADAPDGKIRLMNAAAAEILDSGSPSSPDPTAVEYVGNWELLRPDGAPVPPRELPLARAIGEGTTTSNQEMIMRHESGAERWLLVNAAPIRDGSGEVLGGIAVFPDISDVKKAQRDLIEARQRADAANQAKSVFLANMSHEIRTPLNAVLGFSQLMQKDKTLAPAHRRHVDTILRSGSHLLDLINDVLEMSKIEAGRAEVHRNPFDLHALMDDVAMLLRERAEDKGLSLVVEQMGTVPRHVSSDERKIRQILINLLGNAIKFTDHGSVALRVSSRSGSDAGCQLSFEVRDSGVGIAPKEINQLFRPFGQTRAGIEAKGGTGLGLSISRSYARLIGGDLTVESELGVGSVFTLTVPADRVGGVEAEPAAVPPVVGLAPGQAAPRVLIVDDSADNRQLLAELLSPLGFETRQAVDGRHAIEVFEEWEPGLILMDFRMPRMDGVAATRRIRSMPKGAKVPIVFVTADALQGSEQEAFDAGATAFLRKPVQEADLLQALQELTGVVYIYSLSMAPPARAPASLTPQSVTQLPDELRQQMLAAVTAGDVEALNAAIDDAEEHDGGVAERLRALARRFDYMSLNQLLEPPKPTAALSDPRAPQGDRDGW